MSEERNAVVEARGLRLQFGERLLWDDLGFALHEGEFLAVLGPNGTGKTSLVRILLGLLTPTAGTVRVSGQAPDLARAKVGYVPQQRAFDPDAPLRGCDLVRLGLEPTGPGQYGEDHQDATAEDAIGDEAPQPAEHGCTVTDRTLLPDPRGA